MGFSVSLLAVYVTVGCRIEPCEEVGTRLERGHMVSPPQLHLSALLEMEAGSTGRRVAVSKLNKQGGLFVAEAPTDSR